jgi:hypothetical protein
LRVSRLDFFHLATYWIFSNNADKLSSCHVSYSQTVLEVDAQRIKPTQAPIGQYSPAYNSINDAFTNTGTAQHQIEQDGAALPAS